jgi:hypothetical protein
MTRTDIFAHIILYEPIDMGNNPWLLVCGLIWFLQLTTILIIQDVKNKQKPLNILDFIIQ